VHARLAWQAVGLEAAARSALDAVVRLGGYGGCVAIDHAGHLSAPFTTLAMPRAFQRASGERQIWVLER
jgi:L-asparaginase / beta-aspartyl-peptidase